jgi:capsular polysaccharide transport system ATP-binding protein
MIRIENVSKAYPTRKGWRKVLTDVSMEVRKGEKVGILGLNGSGKSTLIRLIGGAELPSNGTIHRGMKVSWPLAFNGGYQGSLTGLDNLKFVCRLYGADYGQCLPFVEEFSELGPYLDEEVKKYSTGMYARLAFALSMAVDFDCFLIDEILAVGDIRFQHRCLIELFEKRKDRSMIMVSHNEHLIREHADRGAVLVGGRLHHFEKISDAIAFHSEYISRAKTMLL